MSHENKGLIDGDVKNVKYFPGDDGWEGDTSVPRTLKQPFAIIDIEHLVDGPTGTRKEFFKFKCWGSDADFAHKYVTAGRLLRGEGRFTTGTWKSEKSGEWMKSPGINIEKGGLTLLDKDGDEAAHVGQEMSLDDIFPEMSK